MGEPKKNIFFYDVLINIRRFSILIGFLIGFFGFFAALIFNLKADGFFTLIYLKVPIISLVVAVFLMPLLYLLTTGTGYSNFGFSEKQDRTAMRAMQDAEVLQAMQDVKKRKLAILFLMTQILVHLLAGYLCVVLVTAYYIYFKV
jgi:hypothetical protein